MNDTDNTNALIEQLERLRAESDELWEAAIEGCVHPDGRPRHEKRARAERAAYIAGKLWENAIDAARGGEHDRARAELELAAGQARIWRTRPGSGATTEPSRPRSSSCPSNPPATP